MTELNTLRCELIREIMDKSGQWNDTIKKFLDNARFLAEDDGDMGSFSVVTEKDRVGVRDSAEAQYIDSDGIDVVIALIVDSAGFPTDIDFWKVDSTKLINFPTPDAISVRAK